MFGSVTVTRLAKMVVMDRTTLTRNLKPLEKKGLIKVTPGKDRRMKVVTLTEKGNETLSRHFQFGKRHKHILSKSWVKNGGTICWRI